MKNAEITVINKEDFYFAGPSRPLLLTNEQEYGRIIRGYEKVGKKGIKLVVGNVYKIDPEKEKFNLRIFFHSKNKGNKL